MFSFSHVSRILYKLEFINDHVINDYKSDYEILYV